MQRVGVQEVHQGVKSLGFKDLPQYAGAQARAGRKARCQWALLIMNDLASRPTQAAPTQAAEASSSSLAAGWSAPGPKLLEVLRPTCGFVYPAALLILGSLGLGYPAAAL